MQRSEIPKLSNIIKDEEQSIFMSHHHNYFKDYTIKLKQQLRILINDFDQFKDKTITNVNQWMGRISTLMYRTVRQKVYLATQLEKSKEVQNIMRNQVIQLKDMINQAMVDYHKDLESKNELIKTLKLQLQKYEEPPQKIEIKEQQIDNTCQDQELQVIQQESEHATYSSATSLRQFKDQDKPSKEEQSISILPQSHYTDPLNKNSEEQQETIKNEQKRTKCFINNFRKNIEQSFHQKRAEYHHFQQQHNQEKQSQAIFFTHAQPLRQISNQPQQPKYYTNILKPAPSDQIKPSLTTKTLCLQNSNQNISNSSSGSDLARISQREQQHSINPIKKFQTPIHHFFKKKSTTRITQERFKTEPSPQKVQTNNYFSHKPSKPERKSVMGDRSFSDGKSIKTSISKQKIKVTAKIIEEMGYGPRKNHNQNKSVVHLGGKSLFRKFLLELKNAIRKYSVSTDWEEMRFEGEKRGRIRWGKGKLLFRNGMLYEGQFRQNKRHGRGCLSLNGISIYEGQWSFDKIHGEGYIKSMKLLGQGVPHLLSESSYCGNMSENRFNGIGTIFLNAKQKMVTKFNNGIPIGELTYYNLHQIQFGVWPSD